MIEVNDVRIGKEEIKNVVDALSRDEISGNKGEYLDLFENAVASYCDTNYGVSTSSGTAALHLAVLSCGGFPKGTEVLIPNLTMAATAFAVKYIGCRPVPVDVDRHTWNIDPDLIEEKITEDTQAIIPVHLYGNPCDMDKINKIAKKHDLFVIEDCAEALGAEYKFKKVGGLGDCGCHSFYASKMITTGEGGMITANNSTLRDNVKMFKNMAFGITHRYHHQMVGYNYRMTNIQAAIGLAQMRKLDRIVYKKRYLHSRYRDRLQGIDTLEFQDETTEGRSARWMNGILVENHKKVRNYLYKNRIKTGDLFVPMHMQPFINDSDEYPVSKGIAERGFLLPSSVYLGDYQINRICRCIREVINA